MDFCAELYLSNLVLTVAEFDRTLITKFVEIVFIFPTDLVSLDSDKRFARYRQNSAAVPGFLVCAVLYLSSFGLFNGEFRKCSGKESCR